MSAAAAAVTSQPSTPAAAALRALDRAAGLVQLSLQALGIAEARVRLHRLSTLVCDGCRAPAQEFLGSVGNARHLLPPAERFGLALVEESGTARRFPAVLCPGCLSRIRHHPLTHRGRTLQLLEFHPSHPPL